MKRFLQALWELYIYLAFIVGTIVFCFLALAIIRYNLQSPIMNWFEVPLQSGFIYQYDMQDGLKEGHHLSDKSGKIVVWSDVIRFMESGNIIYGYRKDLHGNPFYFICQYGNDCTETQNLTDVELRRIVEEKHLRLYTENSGMSRNDFIQEMNRFDKLRGSDENKPEWVYNSTLDKYRIKSLP